jgi:uncharacterized protein (DUF58 family)
MPTKIVLEAPPGIESYASQGYDEGLIKKRIYIFPTRHGILFMLMLTVMLLGSINYTNSMAYILTFLLSSLFLISMIHTYLNLRGIIIHSCYMDEVYAGEIANIRLYIDNRFGNQRIAVSFENKKDKDSDKNSPLIVRGTFDIKADELHLYTLNAKTFQRGIFELSPIKISTTFPLGLFQAWSNIIIEDKFTVYPAPDGNLPIPVFSHDDKDDQAGTRAGIDDYAGYKAYHPGDSFREIDWKAYAREQGLLIKKFTGSGSEKIILRWDDFPSSRDIEKCLSQFCKWIVDAEAHDTPYGLELPEKIIMPSLGKKHMQACLQALARYGYK